MDAFIGIGGNMNWVCPVSSLSTSWLRGFDQTPALIDQNQLCIDFGKVLGVPIYGHHLVAILRLLVAVWFQVLEGNQIDEWGQEVLSPQLPFQYKVSNGAKVAGFLLG